MDLIFDRDSGDVERVKYLSGKGWANMTSEEQAEWLNGMKGAYNYTDLNRVESAVSVLAEILGVAVTVKTNWAVTDIPKSADMERYLGNIRLLREVNAALANTPSVPDSMTGLDFNMANDIEKILFDIERNIENLTRCGEVYCGEVV